MPALSGAGKKKSSASKVKFRDLPLDRQVHWPLAVRLEGAKSAQKAARKASKKASSEDDILMLHGQLTCPSLCIRYALDVPSSPSPEYGTAAAAQQDSSGGRGVSVSSTTSTGVFSSAGGSSLADELFSPSCSGVFATFRQPVAQVCLADRSILFERVLPSPSARNRSSGRPSEGSVSSVSSAASDPVSQHSYDPVKYPTLRSLLSSVAEGLGQRALRFRRLGQQQEGAVDGGSGLQSSAAAAACTDYILTASSCGTGASPWQQVVVDRSMNMVPVLQLKVEHGRVYLEQCSLPLDDALGSLQLCTSVAYQNAQETAGILSTLSRSDMASTMRMRAFSVDQNVNLPALRADDAGNEGDALQFLAVEVFDIKPKVLVLASLDEHCLLIGREISVPVVPVELCGESAEHYSQASRAMARVLLHNTELLIASTQVQVCDVAVRKQLEVKQSLAPSVPSSSLQVDSILNPVQPMQVHDSRPVSAGLGARRQICVAALTSVEEWDYGSVAIESSLPADLLRGVPSVNGSADYSPRMARNGFHSLTLDILSEHAVHSSSPSPAPPALPPKSRSPSPRKFPQDAKQPPTVTEWDLGGVAVESSLPADLQRGMPSVNGSTDYSPRMARSRVRSQTLGILSQYAPSPTPPALPPRSRSPSPRAFPRDVQQPPIIGESSGRSEKRNSEPTLRPIRHPQSQGNSDVKLSVGVGGDECPYVEANTPAAYASISDPPADPRRPYACIADDVDQEVSQVSSAHHRAHSVHGSTVISATVHRTAPDQLPLPPRMNRSLTPPLPRKERRSLSAHAIPPPDGKPQPASNEGNTGQYMALVE